MKKLILFLTLSAAVMFSQGQAGAVTIGYNFTGEVIDAPGIWATNGVAINDTVTGSFSIDLSLIDENPSPDGGQYTNTVSAPVSITVNAFTFDFSGSQITLFNDSANYDIISIHFQPSNVTSGLITIHPYSSRITLIDTSEMVFSDDTLPADLSVNDFDIQWCILDANPAGGSSLRFWIDSIQPVPLPSTILLLGTGLIGLAGASRRKLKK